MNKKIMITMMIVILGLIVPVLALQVGGIITQAQLDSYNISEMDLGEHFKKDGGNIVYDCKMNKCDFYVVFMYPRPIEIVNETTLESTHTGEYEIEEMEWAININLKNLKTLKKQYKADYINQNYSSGEANSLALADVKTSLKNNLISKKDGIVERFKRKVVAMQTEAVIDPSEYFNGLDV